MSNLIACTLCEKGPAEIDPSITGYCGGCEAMLADRLGDALEAAGAMADAEIARALWLGGFRVIERGRGAVPLCSVCRGSDVDAGAAVRALWVGLEAIREARSASDMRKLLHKVLPLPAELLLWVTLAGLLGRQVQTAALLLSRCPACAQKGPKDAGPKIVVGG